MEERTDDVDTTLERSPQNSLLCLAQEDMSNSFARATKMLKLKSYRIPDIQEILPAILQL